MDLPADPLPPDRWPPAAPPDDAYDADFLDGLYDVDGSCVPRYLSDEDVMYDDLPPMSRVEQLDWEEWAGVEQDEAERAMLRLKAPAWVFLPPGAELAAALEQLRPQCESPIALIEAMKAATRMEAWAASIRTGAQASFVRQRKAQATDIPRPTQIDTSGRPIDPERSWTAEIAAALHLSPTTAARHIDTALHLTGALTATHTALRCGALTFSKALAISEATRPLPPTAAQAVETHVLKRAPGQTHRNLNNSLRRQVAKHTTHEDTGRHRDAVRDRTCKIVPLPDGMAGLWIVHTAEKIQQIWTVIQAMADLAKRDTLTTATTDIHTTTNTTLNDTSDTTSDTTSDGTSGDAYGLCGGVRAQRPSTSGCATPTHTTDSPAAGNESGIVPTGEAPRPQPPETPGPPEPARPARDERLAPQRRADVVADLFEHMLHNGLDWLGRRLPDQHRRRPHIEVLIPITTLLGANDDPCELAGYGPIPAEMARRIATDGTWRRLLTDPTNGTVLEASTTRHDPGTLVTETLLARHPVCAWPGCNRTSRECDRDHGTPFTHTGQTSLAGLAPFCEYHHIIKDTPAWNWSTTNHPDGSVTLTAPTGHRYTTVPPARGPVAQQPVPAPGPPDDPPPF
ncbi:DUF222 domain-containing protein [Kribbella sp. GL6]|uniref:HNH endonuclease signature motif containing protein n=1 Tax=Kribbella sp. GL6 TaxID=3419765 RepID=UPI003D0100E4